MAWTEDTYPHFELCDPNAFQTYPAPQQPTAILQQLPATMMSPAFAPSIRPGGHVKEDLVELMMIQNAQMHQVIMNNMTMSALRSFGYSDPPLGPEAPRDVVIIHENEADPEIYHHHYQSVPYPWPMVPWLLPQATLVYQEDPNKANSAPPPRTRPAVSPPPPPPPPPPPSPAVTVGVSVAPAAENNSDAEAEAEKKRG